ncbi:MAG: hypothetical protein ACRYFR_04900 [Janthinobacterium lividum]
MASSVCNALTKNIVSRKCATAGGIKTRVWVFQAEDFTGAQTFNATGALSSFGLVAGYHAITATGRPKTSNGSNKLTKPDGGGVSVEQALVIALTYGNQTELNAVMDFLRADGKTVFVETNDGSIRQYFQEFGDGALDGDDGSGTLIGDASNTVKATIKGTESNLPRFFEAVITGQQTQLAASKAYLDALVAAGAQA